VKAYYERREPEYDDWYQGVGLYAGREAPGFAEEVEEIVRVVGELPSLRTLDVACGTGYLTRHLRGDVTGLDQSPSMLAIAAARMPGATFVRGDGAALGYSDASFERVFTAHFYGHLEPAERSRFLAEARRVARELVVIDASRGHSGVDEEWQERALRDGSRWRVFKRFFTPEGLLAELGGGQTLFSGRWFVAVRSPA
jgi:ubiquinone/menaquinone biosynthesis C-methylase UbiE